MEDSVLVRKDAYDWKQSKAIFLDLKITEAIFKVRDTVPQYNLTSTNQIAFLYNTYPSSIYAANPEAIASGELGPLPEDPYNYRLDDKTRWYQYVAEGANLKVPGKDVGVKVLPGETLTSFVRRVYPQTYDRLKGAYGNFMIADKWGLGDIYQQHDREGAAIVRIMLVNNITDPDTIFEGQELIVPMSQSEYTEYMKSIEDDAMISEDKNSC